MTSNVVIAIILIVIATIAYFINLFRGKEEDSVSNTLIFTGVSLIASGISALSDAVVDGIFQLLSLQAPANEGGYLFRMIIGLALVILGLVLKFNLKKRVYVLNMYGIAAQKDIDEPKALTDLKLAEHKVKEQIIDFVQLFDGGTAINPKSNKAICKQIENATAKFSAKVTEQKKTCFSGMAPIPYTIYAGTFLEAAKISHYFEYNAHNGGHYYSLKKATKKEIKKGWNKLDIAWPQNIDTNANEVVLAISISHKVNDADLSQFSTDIIHLALNTPQDNVIMYLQQLQEYKNKIDNVIQNELTTKYPNLKTIHIAASVPSCVSVELGKIIGMRTNRMPDIVVHHYISSNTPCYAFGLHVNGSKKGDLWRR